MRGFSFTQRRNLHDFNDFTLFHHGQSIAHVPYHRQVMRHHQVRQLTLLCKIGKQV